jgi:hypothetical protein
MKKSINLLKLQSATSLEGNALRQALQENNLTNPPAPRIVGTSATSYIFRDDSEQDAKDIFGGGDEYDDTVKIEVNIPEFYKQFESYKPFVQLKFLSTRFGNKIRRLPNPDGCVIAQNELPEGVEFAPRDFKNKTSNYTFATQKRIEYINGKMNDALSFQFNPSELFGTFNDEDRNLPPFKFPQNSKSLNENPTLFKNLRVSNSVGNFLGSKVLKREGGSLVNYPARPKNIILCAEIVMIKDLTYKEFVCKESEVRDYKGNPKFDVEGNKIVRPARLVKFYDAAFSNESNALKCVLKLNQQLSSIDDNFYYGWSVLSRS